MQNITENLTSVISQITTMEKENEKLKEENERLLKGFKPDTHILVEREMLNDLVDKADTMVSDSGSVISNCEIAEDEISNAKYYADEYSSVAYDLRDKLEKLLKQKEGENNEK